jgi:hypothetical protein
MKVLLGKEGDIPMLRRTDEMSGFKLSATDGDIGKTKDLLFDDQSWVIRYLVADTGGWLSGRKVLIPRAVLGEPDWSSRRFPVNLSKKQVEESPSIKTDEPVSRQHEVSLHKYLHIDPYWMRVPAGAFAYTEGKTAIGEQEISESTSSGDPHLRSCAEVSGYHIKAIDGEIGHVNNFIVDDENWLIRYLVVDPHNILPGKKVLVAVPWVNTINWTGKRVHVDLTKEQVERSPEFDTAVPVNRRVEEKLYDYYGRPSYWA